MPSKPLKTRFEYWDDGTLVGLLDEVNWQGASPQRVADRLDWGRAEDFQTAAERELQARADYGAEIDGPDAVKVHEVEAVPGGLGGPDYRYDLTVTGTAWTWKENPVKKQIIPRGQKMFLQGFIQTAKAERAPTILDASAKAPKLSKDDLELGLVYYDGLLEGGFDLDLLRKHLKTTGLPLVAMGRLVAAYALGGVHYMILKKDRHLQGKKPLWFFYRDDTVVDLWTNAMTRYAFHVGVMGGRSMDVLEDTEGGHIYRDQRPLYQVEPDRWGWFAQKVLTEESIAQWGFGPGGWLEVYDYALGRDIRVPRIAAVG
jgi:hypothetical protein